MADMTHAELVEVLAEKADLSKSQVDTVLKSLAEVVKTTVKKGGSVKVAGLGKFRVASYKARTGINPQTGEKIKIPARKKVKFSPTKDLKESL